MKENWMPVSGYEGYYEVSDLGRVKSIRGRWGQGRILATHPGNQGYCLVDLRKPREKKMTLVSSLVARAFIGRRPCGMHVCHNNGIKHDDRVENLRYDTPKGNCADKHIHGTAQIGERCSNAKLTEAMVVAIIKDTRQLKEIASSYNVTIAAVSNIKTGKTWTHISRRFGITRQSKRLSKEVIHGIRSDMRQHSEIARTYGVDQSQVSRIKRKVSYGHIA